MRSTTMQIKLYTNSKDLPQLLPGNIQHTALMFRALEESRHAKPYIFVAYENEKELAHLIIIEKRNTLLGIPLPGKHYKIYGEGCYREDCRNREEIYSRFIEEFFKIIDTTHCYTEIKTIEDPRFAYSTLSRRHFIPVRDHRIYISLHSKAPEERLSKRYHSHIRKAQERGASYRTATTSEEIEKALHLLKNYYRSKVRRPSPNISILNKLLTDEGQSNARLFIVEYRGKMIGCSLCTYDKQRAYLAYSCGLRKSHPTLYPGIVAAWAAIEDAHRNGYAHFEFLESRTLAGIRSGYKNFLLNFGGKQVSTLRWYRFGWNFLNKILRRIYV